MQTHHWLMLVIVFLVGYVARGFFPQLASAVGLPG